MKKTAKLLLIAIVCFTTLNSSAQTFGIRGGLNMANLWLEDWDSDDVDKKMNIGYHVGVTVDIPLSDALSMESGLLLATKGVRITETDGGDKYIMSINNNYLDVPIMFKYSLGVNETMKFFGELGPYVGIALSGKEKYKTVIDGDTSTETYELDFGNDEENDDLKRLDYGLTFGGGLDVGIVQVGLYYDLGMANLSFYEGDGAKNRVLRLSVLYSF